MTLQSEDMGKLVAGPLTAEMVPLLTEQSVLTKCAGLAIVRFEGWHLNEVWKRPDVIAGAVIVPHYMFNYLGEITPDGWIEGEWAENPGPGMVVETRIGQRMHTRGDGGIATWDRVTAFRPAHREAQPETDGGGEIDAIINRITRHARATGAAWLEADVYDLVRAFLRDTPEGQTEGAVNLYVPGPVWLEPEITDEDDNPIWTSEVQTIGGHSVIATVHGGSPSEAALRRDVILAALASKGV